MSTTETRKDAADRLWAELERDVWDDSPDDQTARRIARRLHFRRIEITAAIEAAVVGKILAALDKGPAQLLAILDEWTPRPADLEDYMAEAQRRVALTMPLEAAIADAHVDDERTVCRCGGYRPDCGHGPA